MTIKATTFFNTDYVDFASYSNLRMIASVIDGQKNSSRKVLYTVLEKNIKDEIKVSQLGSKVAEFTEYLHGNLDGVIVNLAQNFPGTNNIPLLTREGNFGTRFTQEASASRYIYTFGSSEFFSLFNKEDNEILLHQTFEGSKIEPRFFVPELPLLLINGSEGVSSGFAQKILPRNPVSIAKAIRQILNGDTVDPSLLNPYYVGFNGTIEPGENHPQWILKGVAKKTGMNKVEILEVPIGYDLRGYLDVLDTLEEKKIIQSYVDKSEDDNFLFEVTVASKILKESSDEDILQMLKLVKRVSENYTVIDENNKIRIFDSALDILKHYIKVKLEYISARKQNMIDKLNHDTIVAQSRYEFISQIIAGTLVVGNRKKVDIVTDLDQIDSIICINGSYDYLLRMPIFNLTNEELEKLEKNIKLFKISLNELETQSINEIWLKNIHV
jgi:DNA topoisomerase-2